MKTKTNSKMMRQILKETMKCRNKRNIKQTVINGKTDMLKEKIAKDCEIFKENKY